MLCAAAVTALSLGSLALSTDMDQDTQESLYAAQMILHWLIFNIMLWYLRWRIWKPYSLAKLCRLVCASSDCWVLVLNSMTTDGYSLCCTP